jgi:ABC-2 type transport system permease protein
MVETTLGTVLVIGAAGLGAGVADALVTGDSGQVWPLLQGALAYLPAAFALAGLAFLLFGWLPRTAAAVSWGVLAVCVVIGWLGEAISLPDSVIDLSPYTQMPQVPVDPFAWTPVLVAGGLALALAAAGAVGLRRRDIG